MIKIGLTGNIGAGAEFLSCRDAAKSTGLDEETIRKNCVGQIKKPKKYKWRYK
jgi:hypothetical protein